MRLQKNNYSYALYTIAVLILAGCQHDTSLSSSQIALGTYTRGLAFENDCVVVNQEELKNMVILCLANDPTGNDCLSVCGDQMSTWDTSNVTNMSGLFRDAIAFNADLSGWNTANVVSMGAMFSGATAFNADLSGWNTANVQNMKAMFNGATAFNADLSGWDTSNVTAMGSMFSGATAFNADISGWNTANVQNMSGMFNGATAFNADLSGCDTSNVTNMGNMFYGATAFNADLSGWNTSNVTRMTNMFYGATAFNADLSCWNTTALTEFADIFRGASSNACEFQGLGSSSIACPAGLCNDTPIARDISKTIDEDVALQVRLKGSDIDTLTFEIVAEPQHGALTGLNADTGQVTYTPALNFNGADSFTYRINDGRITS
ncbi:MAG: BspA family leucine-rich repeat surface protein, partial [Myxococcota bacterium]|nr:BspA family leucine-rich repeat surface protein [Myxococcota bacterium]